MPCNGGLGASPVIGRVLHRRGLTYTVSLSGCDRPRRVVDDQGAPDGRRTTATRMGTFLMLTTSESGRPLYGQKDLGSLLAPRSVVVVGASERPGSFGGQVLRNALTSKLDVSVVNPRASSILGVPAAPSLAALDRAVDVAAVCVPQAAVLDSLREAVSLGIPSAIIYSSGFAETGRIQRDLPHLPGSKGDIRPPQDCFPAVKGRCWP